METTDPMAQLADSTHTAQDQQAILHLSSLSIVEIVSALPPGTITRDQRQSKATLLERCLKLPPPLLVHLHKFADSKRKKRKKPDSETDEAQQKVSRAHVDTKSRPAAELTIEFHPSANTKESKTG